MSSHRRLLWSVPLLAGALLGSGCSAEEGTTGTSGGTSAATTGGSTGGSSAGSTTGASTTGSAGSSGGSGTSGDISGFNDGPKPRLDGGDGITGTANGAIRACTDNPQLSEQLTDSPFFSMVAKCPDGGSWTLHVPKAPGTYGCTNVATAQYGTGASILGPTGTGTAAGTNPGACQMVVKRSLGSAEGSFTGTLAGVLASAVPLTEGYFSFAKGIPDCSLGIDPGLPAGQNGASFALTNTTRSVGKLRCGLTGVFVVAVARNRDIDTDPYLQFAAPGGTELAATQLQLKGIRKTGTFECGQPGDPAQPTSKPIVVRLAETYSNTEGGTCTVVVDKYEADLIEGSYKAAVWNARTSSPNIMTFEGHFRSPRSLGFPPPQQP